KLLSSVSMLLYALARPLVAQTLAAANSSITSDLFDPTTGECIHIEGCRTVSDIIYSCLSVVLICTWVAIHPNVPEVGKHWTVVLYDDFQIMIIALLAPELIIIWAMRQWISAKKITEKYKKYGWGMSHAFLVLMGGFTLYDGEKFCGYLLGHGLMTRMNYTRSTGIRSRNITKRPGKASAAFK
ncbi:hypothetical protein MPER_01227, partial [Moniliophthora perniciosa FA553]